jgi:hypothetical protein
MGPKTTDLVATHGPCRRGVAPVGIGHDVGMASVGGQGRGRLWHDRRAWIVAAVVLLAVVAVPALVLALGSSGTPSSSSSGGGNGGSGGGAHGNHGSTSTSTSSSTTTTDLFGTTTSTSIGVAPVVPPTAPTTAPIPMLSGRVTRAGGAPVPHAYVIGLDNVVLATTNVKGEFKMPCTGQSLVASPWLMPVQSTGGTTVSGAAGTTPNTLGQGYAFSGGVSDIDKAARVPCDAKRYDIRLPLGATVAINLTAPGGGKFTPTPGAAPADAFSLPGFGGRADLVGAKVSSAGVQILSQLGAGELTLHVAHGTFACRGAGVNPTTPSTSVGIATAPGRLVLVKCQMSG